MYIYHYSKTTGEYLTKSKAEADPAQTKKQGEFVPLVPKYATTLEPPETETAIQTPVFTNGAWVLTADYRNTHKKCDDNFTITDITTLGELTDGYLVTNELAELIQANSDNYKISEGEVVEKDDDDKAKDREEQFKSEFFETSLGWIRRTVTMADGTTKNFLSDLLIPIKTGLELGQTITIITYNTPDFTQEYTDEYIISLQEKKEATTEFIQECLLQLMADFGS